MTRAAWCRRSVIVVNPEAYLGRIGLDAQIGPPTLDLLTTLQLAHLVAVPFENMHVYHRRGVRTDLEWSLAKVVDDRRGGWCFELNGAFSALLRAVGFDVDLVACRVWNADPGEWGSEFDHLALVVRVDGGRWLVDVGFGDNCIQPLLLEPGEREAVPRRARLDVTAESFVLTEYVHTDDGRSMWEPQSNGSFTPRQLSDFNGRSRSLQAGSPFTEKPFTTRALDERGSRVTLRRDVLRRRDAHGEVTDAPVAAEEWSELLAEHFDLVDTRE